MLINFIHLNTYDSADQIMHKYWMFLLKNMLKEKEDEKYNIATFSPTL